MPRFDPFASVGGKYGAPMGRGWDATANFQDGQILYARHQGGGDGYDKGGAYWGLPSNVGAVWTRGGEAVNYVRARGRNHAIELARKGEFE